MTPREPEARRQLPPQRRLGIPVRGAAGSCPKKIIQQARAASGLLLLHPPQHYRLTLRLHPLASVPSTLLLLAFPRHQKNLKTDKNPSLHRGHVRSLKASPPPVSACKKSPGPATSPAHDSTSILTLAVRHCETATDSTSLTVTSPSHLHRITAVLFTRQTYVRGRLPLFPPLPATRAPTPSSPPRAHRDHDKVHSKR